MSLLGLSDEWVIYEYFFMEVRAFLEKQKTKNSRIISILRNRTQLEMIKLENDLHLELCGKNKPF